MPVLPQRRRNRGGSSDRAQSSSPPATDRARLLESGLFDPWYYGLQTGVEREPIEALDHYLTVGAADGMLPNPLTDIDATGLASEQVTAALLDGSARTFPIRPLLDEFALIERTPAAIEHPGGPAGFYLVHAHSGAPVPSLGKRSWDRFVRLRRQQAKSLKTILASGLFDTGYYATQAGRHFVGERQAVWHFLEIGEALGLSPSPLYEMSWYRRSARKRGVRTNGAQVFAQFLRHEQLAGAAGPHFDASVYLAEQPDAARHPGGPLGHYLEQATESTLTVPTPDGEVVAVPWAKLKDEVLRAASDFGNQRVVTEPPPSRWAQWYLDQAVPPQGTPQPVAIVTDSRAWSRDLPAELDHVLAQSHQDWTMHIAVDSDHPVPEVLTDLAMDPRFVLVNTTQDSWAGRANDVIATLDAPWTCFWQPGHVWSTHLLSGLLSGVAEGKGAYAAVLEESDADRPREVRGALPPRHALLWNEPRSLAAMLLSTQQLAVDGGTFRAEAEDQYGWDFLLRSATELTFVPFVGVRGTDVTYLPLAPGLRSAHEHVLRAEQILSWTDIERAAANRIPGRISLLIPTFRDHELTRAAISHALERADGDLEVVVIDNGSDRQVSAILTSCFAADPRVCIRRVARNTNFATASNLAFADSTGEFVVFLNNDTRAHPGWLTPLIDALGQPDVLGAQPLLVYEDHTVQSAGTLFQGPHALPIHLLASHPVEDALRGEDLRFDAVTAACMAVRAELIVAARGFDPVFMNGMEDVDLCLRLGERHGGHFVTARSSRVTHLESKTPGRFARVEPNRLRFLERWGHRLPQAQTAGWEQAGFAVVGQVAQAGLPGSGRRTALQPMLIRPRSVNETGPATGLPRLRWAIKNAAPAGRYGDLWGDTYFADDLAQALRAWGQDAFVDRRQAHVRPGVDHLDDVTLTLRGRIPAVAQPGATNVMWVISHPDDVDVAEVRQGFDLVYSAGRAWAEQMSRDAGQTIRTLLQATNTTRFRPDGDQLDLPGALFVGHTRGVLRPIVRDAIEGGAELRIFGNGWGEYVDAAHIVADHLPNHDLPAAYRGARIVLNDHWADMARLGFFSNRLFDAVAAGARVVSDPVDGIEEIFGPSVRTYRSVDELRQLLDPAEDVWPDQSELASNAAAIASAHSFTERARVLLADVLDLRGVEHNL